MTAKNSPSATISSLNYRDANETPTTTPGELLALSASALGLLARSGSCGDGGANPGDKTWSVTVAIPSWPTMTISCSGPDLPDRVPGAMAHPSIIPFQRPWIGTYRLVVTAPLTVLDLYWRADAPLRIMGFSRGDWEANLEVLARR